MYDPSGLRKLQHSLDLLAAAQVVPRAGQQLDATMAEAARLLRDAVLEEIPAFSASANPEVLPALSQHVDEHVGEIRRLFAGGGVGDFGFVRTHAQRRAEQRFPLEVTLHAYRCGHRVLSQWLREAVAATAPLSTGEAASIVADFAIEYTDSISVIAASEYVARTRTLTEAEGDQRTELLNILLSGYDESDGRVARLLKRAGYLEQRQAYCVAVAQPSNPSEMEHPERARRIIDAITDVMAGTAIRTLAGVRNTLVTAVLSDRRRQSGWTATQSDLAERVRPLLQMLGPSVLVGISADHPSTAYLPRGLQEATSALDFASVTERVVAFSGLPVRGLLVMRGADAVRATPPAWMEPLLAADTASAGSLIGTLRAFADADMNMQKAARQLGKHPNTLYARLVRIRDLTGLDGQHYRDLTELLLAADCWRA
jgi:PucR C-terminal helix-turn-helix domain/GGDEF-like domain